MTSYTPKLDLAKQDTGAQGWGTVLNQNFDKIDAGFGEIGVKVYSATVTYASGEFVIASVSGVVGLYKSLQGDNVGHALTDTTWWEAVPLSGSADVDGQTISKNASDELQAIGLINKNPAVGVTNPIYDWEGTLEEYEAQNVETLHPEYTCFITDDLSPNIYPMREIGEIVASTIPLTNAGLHLLDGSLINGSGSYADFVSYIANLYNGGLAANCFCTEAQWQTSVMNYGACDKYVYDSVSGTVRLPKRSTEHGALIYSSTSGATHIRVYSDGWCEQAWHANAGASGNALISLPKAFKDTNYTVLGLTKDVADPYPEGVATWPYSGSQFYAISAYNGTFHGTECTWYACGFVDVSAYQYSPIYEYVVIATSAKTEIEVDIDEIATDLNGKADVDAGNFNATGKNTIVGWGMPDYSAGITIQNGSYSSGSYTAPSRGELHLYMIPGAGSTTFTVNNIPVGGQKPATGSPYSTFNYAMLEQGDVAAWTVSASSNVQAYFYPLRELQQ